jgi:hypothetical protein
MFRAPTTVGCGWTVEIDRATGEPEVRGARARWEVGLGCGGVCAGGDASVFDVRWFQGARQTIFFDVRLTKDVQRCAQQTIF